MLQTNADKKAFNRTVLALVVPMALQNLINVGVQSADVFMLGKVGEIALSAASLAGQVQFVLIIIFFGIASGAAVLTSQYWGKGNTRAIEKVLSMALRLSMLVALVFAGFAMFAPTFLMGIFTNQQQLIELGAAYLRVVAPSYLTMAFTVVYLNIMRSVEKVIISTAVYSVSLLVNIFANWVFIFGNLGAKPMGVVGAALGTTCARFVELIIVAIYAAKNKTLRLKFLDFIGFDMLLFKDFKKYAGVTMLNEMVWALGIAANAAIIGRLGSAAVAANSVGQVARQLATTVSFGVAHSAAIMVGKAIGQGQPQKAASHAGRLMRLSLLTGIVGGGIVLLCRPFIIKEMKFGPEANDFLNFILLVMFVYVSCQAISAVMVVGIFRGGGDPHFGLFLDLTTMWGFSILLGALAAFVFNWPPKAVLLILLLDEVVKLPLCLLRYKSRRWLKDVTR